MRALILLHARSPLGLGGDCLQRNFRCDSNQAPSRTRRGDGQRRMYSKRTGRSPAASGGKLLDKYSALRYARPPLGSTGTPRETLMPTRAPPAAVRRPETQRESRAHRHVCLWLYSAMNSTPCTPRPRLRSPAPSRAHVEPFCRVCALCAFCDL